MSLSRKQQSDLQVLAANCGIDARGLTPQDVRFAHNAKRDPEFGDQHDARLDEFLSQIGA